MSDARCARESLDRAVAQLDRPTLTAWHEHNLPGAGDRRLTSRPTLGSGAAAFRAPWR